MITKIIFEMIMYYASVVELVKQKEYIYIYIYTHAHILNTDNFFHIIIFFSVLIFSLTNPRPLAPSRDTAQWSSQQWLVP